MHNEFKNSDSFFSGNAIFAEELFAKYRQNPSSVGEEWQQFFKDLADMNPDLTQIEGPSWAPRTNKVIGQVSAEEIAETKANSGKKGQKKGEISEEALEQASYESVRALMMIHAYRVRGHLMADLDPLNLDEREYHPELDPATYGFCENDMDKEIYLHGKLGLKKASLGEILSILQETYCSKIGIEFMHIQDPNQKQWIQHYIEGTHAKPNFSKEEKSEILDYLVEVESFESFLSTKYKTTKRFSLQGGDTTISGLKTIINTAADLGVEDICFGMPHRGRLSVLTTVMRKPYVEMFSLFHGNLDFPEWVNASGDVKYHLGASSDFQTPSGKKVHLSLASNPSHLEAVNPVVAGKVRAKLSHFDDMAEKDKVMGVLLHGDAAFSGQGVVPETLALADIRGYRTGGTIHLIVNNQIGFTTSPRHGRFTPYCTDVAKGVQAPIFHVNGDDAESVTFICRLATEFRQKFKRDVVIDIICYRKFGHNESDEPMFTQPKMYTAIKDHPLPAKVYADKLLTEGTLSQEEINKKYQQFKEFFEKEFDAAKDFRPNKANWLEGQWSGMEKPQAGVKEDPSTGVEIAKLKKIGRAISKAPENFNANRKILRQMENRAKMIDSGAGIDWATAEALAFGTLLSEDFSVRLSGQDVERGTFSHRHSVLIDQENEGRYIPLNNLGGKQKYLEVLNSNLSEFAILGFEYGHSLAHPNCLTLWEAQFGDFANGAQVIIDQFISSGEIKWLRMSGLVMLLPHGYEGQGPEHSSARLERFLQLCAEDNMQVCNISTPANYFHALRRQLHRNFRKPLVIMTPKSLLRHKLCISSLQRMGPNMTFSKVIGEVENIDAKKVKRVVICSGKVYYDLYEKREEKKIKDVAIIRMEQLYPFSKEQLKAELKKYETAQIVWCQEEPKNMGAWYFISDRIEEVMAEMKLKQDRLIYAGRKPAASPAAGYLAIHNKEQEDLINDALNIDGKKTRKNKAA